jgi:co-chaperonin GroES (HSP10)
MMPTPAPDPTEATTAHLPEVAPVPQTQVKTPFVPRSNRLLIKPDSIAKTVGRIVIPDNANALDEGRHWSGLTCRTARVISVGPGLHLSYPKWIGHRDENGNARWPMHGIKAGMRILYRAWAGNDVVVEDEKYQVVSVNLVDAIILDDGQLDLIEDRLLVQRRKRLEQTRGGIWIPEIAQKNPLEGEVLQTGPGKIITNGITMPFDANPGDHVAWRPMKGVDVSKYVPRLATRMFTKESKDGERYQSTETNEVVLLFETDLIGVIEGEHFEPVVSVTKEQ